eukprot:1340411-Pyramimonas_sp.AAC.1
MQNAPRRGLTGRFRRCWSVLARPSRQCGHARLPGGRRRTHPEIAQGLASDVSAVPALTQTWPSRPGRALNTRWSGTASAVGLWKVVVVGRAPSVIVAAGPDCVVTS